MNHSQKAAGQLKRVSARLRVDAIVAAFFFWFLVGTAVYALLLLASRLTGLIPDVFDLQSLLWVPAAALALGLLFHRRPTLRDAARRIDSRQGTKDLFLTLVLIEPSAGEFRPLVEREAEAAAPAVRPREVVPFRWSSRFCRAAIALIVLWGGLHLQQFDPFGKVEAAQEVTRRREELAESRKATELRKAELKRDDAEKTGDVEQSLEKLKTAFRRMQPREKQANRATLREHQRTLGEKWRKLSDDKLRKLLNRPQAGQRFGRAENEKLDRWTQELKNGSTAGLQQELGDLKQILEELKNTSDPAKQAALKQKLKKRLKDLEEFASEKADAQQLSAALKRALQQLECSQCQGLGAESLAALSESLDLSALELEQLAQSLEDLKSLEEALQALQLAKQLNEGEKLDGEACKNCRSIGDYAELYAKMCSGMGGSGSGPGMRGKGTGQGGRAPEDDSQITDFQPQRSRSAVTAGKTLLSLKTKGLGPGGEAQRNYREAIRTIKQGVSEAIEQEQIPPGYHEGIKSYFNTIEPSPSDPETDAGQP